MLMHYIYTLVRSFLCMCLIIKKMLLLYIRDIVIRGEYPLGLSARFKADLESQQYAGLRFKDQL